MIEDKEAYKLGLELHPELRDWTEADFERAKVKDEVNWRLHLILDGVVLRRTRDASLPDAKVIDELRNLGNTRLEAIHLVAEAIAGHLWKLLWVGRIQSGQIQPEDAPEKLRGAALPTNEELDEKIRGLVGKRKR
jgi:hypothetical protein